MILPVVFILLIYKGRHFPPQNRQSHQFFHALFFLEVKKTEVPAHFGFSELTLFLL